MVGKIIGVILSIVMIIGGLTGKLVLRGTNSSKALVVAGVILLIISIFRLVKEIKRRKNTEADR